MCIVASPNPELSEGANPHHFKENTHSELRSLFGKHFAEVEILEPTCEPVTDAGKKAGPHREHARDFGKFVTPDLKIFGSRVDQRFLSNTHSFICFARSPLS
jgi:hypothetical protein